MCVWLGGGLSRQPVSLFLLPLTLSHKVNGLALSALLLWGESHPEALKHYALQSWTETFTNESQIKLLSFQADGLSLLTHTWKAGMHPENLDPVL